MGTTGNISRAGRMAIYGMAAAVYAALAWVCQ